MRLSRLGDLKRANATTGSLMRTAALAVTFTLAACTAGTPPSEPGTMPSAEPSLPIDQLRGSIPATVGGAPITLRSISDNAPLSGVPADDVLSALHKTRSQAVVLMGTWSNGDVSALSIPDLPGATVLATTEAKWDAPAVIDRSTATVGGRSVAVLSRRDGVKAYVFAIGSVVYAVDTGNDANASELIAAIH